MKKEKKETEAQRDKRIHEEMIERFKQKGLSLIKGIWQKPTKKK